MSSYSHRTAVGLVRWLVVLLLLSWTVHAVAAQIGDVPYSLRPARTQRLPHPGVTTPTT